MLNFEIDDSRVNSNNKFKRMHHFCMTNLIITASIGLSLFSYFTSRTYVIEINFMRLNIIYSANNLNSKKEEIRNFCLINKTFCCFRFLKGGIYENQYAKDYEYNQLVD